MRLVDVFVAMATWLGAYRKATARLGYAKGSRKAFDYADDIVVKTQGAGGKGEVAPIQRTNIGRFFTLFQMFSNNQAHWIAKDVLGYKSSHKLMSVSGISKLFRLTLAMTAANILFEDFLGQQSPFPTPIRDFRQAYDDSDSILEAAANGLASFADFLPPVQATRRYGGSLMGAGITEAEKAMGRGSRYKREMDILELLQMASRPTGVYPGSGQTTKMIRAYKRGEPFWRVLLGSTSPEEPSGGRGRGRLGGRGR
jgi:hypothetical protein